ncbi:MAG: hypothetical protein AAFY60_19090, partial [Myxococcota bacterium]
GAFRGRWYNFYERGRSYLDGGYVPEAISDFEHALALRPRDQRRARTYGLHFVDYFANRELGIATLADGQAERAVELLERSLVHVDSGRAEFYLNRARRQLLVDRGVKDAQGPLIEVPGLDGSLQRAAAVDVLGTVRDSSGVSRVKVNGTPILLPTSQLVVDLKTSLSLPPGSHSITIDAWDLFENHSRLLTKVQIDPSPPVLAINGLSETRGETVIELRAQDDIGLAQLRVGARVYDDAAGQTAFSTSATVPGDALIIRAEDRAGNSNEIKVDISELRSALAAADDAAPKLALSELPPRTSSDRVFLDGTVSDVGGIQKLTVNGRTIATEGRRSIYLRQAVDLQFGSNTIAVVAVDDGGRTSKQDYAVEREPPVLEADENRLSIAMAPIVEKS